MENLEIFPGDRIFVALPQEPNIVCAFEFFDAVWISPNCLDKLEHLDVSAPPPGLVEFRTQSLGSRLRHQLKAELRTTAE